MHEESIIVGNTVLYGEIEGGCYFRRVFFQAEAGIRTYKVTGVQTCALPIYIPLHRGRQAVPGNLGNLGQLRENPSHGAERGHFRTAFFALREVAVGAPAGQWTEVFARVQCQRRSIRMLHLPTASY